ILSSCSNAKSSAVATQQWNSYELTVGKCTSRGTTITSSGNALEHFIPNTSVRRPLNRDSSFKNNVLSNTKNSLGKVEVSDRSNKKSDVASKKILDSGSSKHMMGDQSLLENFAKKFMGTVHYGNDRDDLLTRDRESNLYIISISDMAASSPVCLMSKATSTKSWLWHRRLSHLNFGTINGLTKHDLVDGLPKFKYGKYHLCSACERGKSKKASHPPKVVPSNHSKLELLHIDLCGPMRVASINGKRYILVIVNDYSRFTWIRTDNSTESKMKLLNLHDNQEDSADFNGNTTFVPYDAPKFEEDESSTIALDLSSMSSTKYNPQCISGLKLIL
nr:integrase, catalytic region, zinc finger, CCHC-type, peptidase aspartic, catalytic [Tanacetum cinerariifolium]